MYKRQVETWTGWTTNEFESLDIKDIEKLAKTKGIADYNITTATTPVNPVNFKRIEDKDVDQSVDEGGVSLIGNKDMKLDRNVLSGNLHIITAPPGSRACAPPPAAASPSYGWTLTGTRISTRRARS